MEREEGKGRYDCAAHGCNQYANVDDLCWMHSQSSPADWPRVTEAMRLYSNHLNLINLMQTERGRQKLASKHGGLEEALKKASEWLNDKDVLPIEEDNGRCGFSWYSWVVRMRRHLLQVMKKKREVRRWDLEQEAA